MARHDKLALLRELQGEEGFEEIEGSNHIRINGERAYVLDPTRALSMRHELVADLAATGMKPSEISRVVKTNGDKSDGGYYATLLRDPRIRARARADIKDTIEEAKKLIQGSVIKAAENIKSAVHNGDVKVSQYVLATQGITDKVAAQQTNVNVDFGAWLSQHTNTKTMHNLKPREIDVTPDHTALPPATGHTLTGEKEDDND